MRQPLYVGVLCRLIQVLPAFHLESSNNTFQVSLVVVLVYVLAALSLRNTSVSQIIHPIKQYKKPVLPKSPASAQKIPFIH